MDTDRPDDRENGDAYEPVEATTSIDATHGADEPAVTTAPAPKSRLLLATLAGLTLVAVGVVAWPVLYMTTNRDFPGITVVFALLIGYVVRELARRRDLVPAVVAGLLTAVLCLVGNVAATAAGLSEQYKLPFMDNFTDLMSNPFGVLVARTESQDLPVLRFVIFAFAVVSAFVSAMPPKPGKQKAGGQST